MNTKEYEKQSARTMAPTMYDGVFIPETLHGIIGISTEAGELLDAVKKGLFYGHAPDMKNIREEIGDVMWYIFAVVRAEGWDLEEILQENIDKLRLRYPEQFTTEHSAIRLDKKLGGFCDGCKYLKPSEEKQTEDKEHHWCTHFKIILMHGRWHPNIPMPWDIKCTIYEDKNE